ncbi:UPF0489 protein C5orf22 homolog [Amphibalanus amphitrite]|uniref:UPF0489 protein C5orf22 homolog n=1 Tax=Amphibalanus amphitrite TaxID=1232801 RepID=UPI001C929819|nr:UPF0489 protein C5orf22 homolog [Amphibalanus amphitrite]XP_043188220.1 UPF0489 protein C5orf22 homolog [Amphibalanus amphitrite]XP_043188221.1 UPF0489 protein C5orf22 homolog [Amphibalanus amphitrite]XP_043188222.1 UPF0489 protein C5orf22 homolog [Amphibalanus amphitrite]XP_043188223.1 UPF0489 protein C5orf22 homolog [Amphibalanus amphitrite]
MKSLEAYIVEDHNEALEWIYREIGAKRLPVHGSTLLHFDSHPDLLLPTDLGAEEAACRESLLPQLSIGDWILPAVFAGHLGDVLWVRPPWAPQLPEGELRCTIGETADGLVRLDCRHPYFVSELLYAPAEELRNTRTFSIVVVTLGEDTSTAKAVAELAPRLRDTPYILDIDLDFFSTHDPFRAMLPKADMHGRLQKLFAFEVSDDITAAQECRRALLTEAKAVFDHLDRVGSLEGFTGPSPETELMHGLRELAAAVGEHYTHEEVDWQLVYDAACTFDTCGLPHHVSTDQQVESSVEQVSEFLSALPEPGCVTIARSSLDDFCPPDQVEDIQQSMLDRLTSLYPRLRVNVKYEVDEEPDPDGDASWGSGNSPHGDVM